MIVRGVVSKTCAEKIILKWNGFDIHTREGSRMRIISSRLDVAPWDQLKDPDKALGERETATTMHAFSPLLVALHSVATMIREYCLVVVVEVVILVAVVVRNRVPSKRATLACSF